MFGSVIDNPNYILTQITPFNFGYFSLFLLVTFGAAIFYIFFPPFSTNGGAHSRYPFPHIKTP